MGHVAFLLAFVGLPVLSFYFVRSLTWVAVYVAGAVSLAGLGVGKLIELGWEWNFLTLQVVLQAAHRERAGEIGRASCRERV